MPVYEYRCDKGHSFEVLQRMTDDPVTTCQTCEAPVQRVFHPVAVHFKGSGFYTTDYARKNDKKPAGDKDKGADKKSEKAADASSTSKSSSSSSSSDD